MLLKERSNDEGTDEESKEGGQWVHSRGVRGGQRQSREIVARSYLGKCDSFDPVTGTSINKRSVDGCVGVLGIRDRPHSVNSPWTRTNRVVMSSQSKVCYVRMNSKQLHLLKRTGSQLHGILVFQCSDKKNDNDCHTQSHIISYTNKFLLWVHNKLSCYLSLTLLPLIGLCLSTSQLRTKPLCKLSGPPKLHTAWSIHMSVINYCQCMMTLLSLVTSGDSCEP